MAATLLTFPACADTSASSVAADDEERAVKGEFRCDLIESITDATGTLTVRAYAAPAGADGAILRELDDLVVIASNRHLHVLDTTEGFCATARQVELPDTVAALGKAQRIITHGDRFIIAYELGVASVARNLSEARVLLRFGEHVDQTLLNTKALHVIDDTLIVGAWRDLDAFDNDALEALFGVFDLHETLSDEEIHAEIMRQIGAPLFFVDLVSGAVSLSPAPELVFAIRTVDRGRALYFARDFGSDLLCELETPFDPDTLFDRCRTGGAVVSMSVTPLTPRQCAALGRAGECYLIPEDHLFSVLGAPFDPFDVVHVSADSVGGSRPVFWDAAPLVDEPDHFVVTSGRMGGFWDYTFSRSTGLRNTCFSRYRAAFEESPPAMLLDTYVCTRTETLTSTNNLIPVACPPDSDAASCFVGMNLAFSPNESVLYWIEAR